MYNCISQRNKTSGAFTVAFHQEANSFPYHLMPPETVIPFSQRWTKPCCSLVFPLSHWLLPKYIYFSISQPPRTSCSELSCEIHPCIRVPSSWSAPSTVCVTPTALLSTSTGFSLSPKSCRFYSSCPHFWAGLLAINDCMKIGYYSHILKERWKLY